MFAAEVLPVGGQFLFKLFQVVPRCSLLTLECIPLNKHLFGVLLSASGGLDSGGTFAQRGNVGFTRERSLKPIGGWFGSDPSLKRLGQVGPNLPAFVPEALNVSGRMLGCRAVFLEFAADIVERFFKACQLARCLRRLSCRHLSRLVGPTCCFFGGGNFLASPDGFVVQGRRREFLTTVTAYLGAVQQGQVVELLPVLLEQGLRRRDLRPRVPAGPRRRIVCQPQSVCFRAQLLAPRLRGIPHLNRSGGACLGYPKLLALRVQPGQERDSAGQGGQLVVDLAGLVQTIGGIGGPARQL